MKQTFLEFIKKLDYIEQGTYNFETSSFADFCGSMYLQLCSSAKEQGFIIKKIGSVTTIYKPNQLTTFVVREENWGDIEVNCLFYSDLAALLSKHFGHDKKAQKEVLAFLAERVEALY